jgi:hypothetical protein
MASKRFFGWAALTMLTCLPGCCWWCERHCPHPSSYAAPACTPAPVCCQPAPVCCPAGYTPAPANYQPGQQWTSPGRSSPCP